MANFMAHPEQRHPFEQTSVHADGNTTVLYQGRRITLEETGPGDRLLIRPEDLVRVTGFELKPGMRLHMYSSQPPCGDAALFEVSDAPGERSGVGGGSNGASDDAAPAKRQRASTVAASQASSQSNLPALDAAEAGEEEQPSLLGERRRVRLDGEMEEVLGLAADVPQLSRSLLDVSRVSGR